MTLRPQRKRMRLAAFDYSAHGAYFVTTVTHQREEIFGSIVEDQMILSDVGQAAHIEWSTLSDRFVDLILDAFVVMPNHVHGVLFLDRLNSAFPGTPTTVSAVVGAFKSLSAKRVNRILGRSGSVWQRSYHERVIRNERELNDIRRYIAENPLRWALDKENPLAGG